MESADFLPAASLAMLEQDRRIRNIVVQSPSAVNSDRALRRRCIAVVNLDQADNGLGPAGSKRASPERG